MSEGPAITNRRSQGEEGRPAPQGVGLNDPLSIPDAARWVRVDEATLRERMEAAGAVYSGFGPARVIAGEVLMVLRGEPVRGKAPQARRRSLEGKRIVSATQPLPRKDLK